MTRDSERAALRPDIGSDVASSKAPADAAPQPRLRSGRGFGISVLFAVAGQCTITPFFDREARKPRVRRGMLRQWALFFKGHRTLLNSHRRISRPTVFHSRSICKREAITAASHAGTY